MPTYQNAAIPGQGLQDDLLDFPLYVQLRVCYVGFSRVVFLIFEQS